MYFDFLASIDQESLNKVIRTLYERPNLRNKLFSGHRQFQIFSQTIKVEWTVESVPTLNLNPPSQQQWNTAITPDGQPVAPRDNAFLCNVSAIRIKRFAADGTVYQTVLPFNLICWLGLANNTLGYRVLGVNADLSRASVFDRELYNEIIGDVITMVTDMLGHQYIPNMALHGLRFGSLSLAVEGGRITGAANLEGSPPADRPNYRELPSRPFYVLLSRKALNQTTEPLIKRAQGTSTSTSGTKKADVAEASYSASITINRLEVEFASDPTIVNGRVDFSAQASAGVSVFEAIINRIAEEMRRAANAIADAFRGY